MHKFKYLGLKNKKIKKINYLITPPLRFESAIACSVYKSHTLFKIDSTTLPRVEIKFYFLCKFDKKKNNFINNNNNKKETHSLKKKTKISKIKIYLKFSFNSSASNKCFKPLSILLHELRFIS